MKMISPATDIDFAIVLKSLILNLDNGRINASCRERYLLIYDKILAKSRYEDMFLLLSNLNATVLRHIDIIGEIDHGVNDLWDCVEKVIANKPKEEPND